MAQMNLHGSPRGSLVATINGQRAFVPDPLPRQLDLNSELVFQLDVASRAVANLAGVGETVQNPHLLIRPLTTTLSNTLGTKPPFSPVGYMTMSMFNAFLPSD